MAYPDKPVLDYSYTGFATSQGDNSFPGSEIDNDLANLKAATDSTIDFLRGTFTAAGILAVAALPQAADLTAYTAVSQAAATAASASATSASTSASAAATSAANAAASAASVTTTNFLARASNLSDLPDKAAARGASGLGLGALAVKDNVSLSDLVAAVQNALAPAGVVEFFAGLAAPAGWLECDGSAVSRTTYAGLFAALVKSATATMTIASPGVVTWNAHGLKNGYPIKFSTTGALPTGFTAGTTYYIVNATTNTFQLAATAGGSAINTSGTQSGVHTAICAPHGTGDGSTTFNLPDPRGEFFRGWDNGRGVDVNRGYGTAQAEMVGPHNHTITALTARNTASGGTETIADSQTNTTLTTANNSGTENRPRNVTYLVCIKT